MSVNSVVRQKVRTEWGGGRGVLGLTQRTYALCFDGIMTWFSKAGLSVGRAIERRMPLTRSPTGCQFSCVPRGRPNSGRNTFERNTLGRKTGVRNEVLDWVIMGRNFHDGRIRANGNATGHSNGGRDGTLQGDATERGRMNSTQRTHFNCASRWLIRWTFSACAARLEV